MLTLDARSVSVLTLLAMFPGAGAAAVPGDRVRLDSRHRAPLPEHVEVSEIASTANRVWFLGLDRGVDPPVSVLYSWSREGVQRVELPKGNAAALAAAHNGDALLLVDGRLYSLRAGARAVSAPLTTAAIDRIAGGDGFWLLSSANEILHLASIDDRPRAAARTNASVTAWTTGANGELWYGGTDGSVWSAAPHSAPKQLEVPGSVPVTAIHADVSEQVWIAFADGRLARTIAGATDWYTPAEAPIRWIVADSWGNLLLGYAQPESEETWLLSQPRNLRSNLTADFRKLSLASMQGAIRSIATDPLGGTWVSSGRNGAYRLEGTSDLNWLMGDSRPAPRTPPLARVTRAAAVDREKRVFGPIPGLTAYPGAKQTVINKDGGLASNHISCAVSDGAAMWFTTGYSSLGPGNESFPGSGLSRFDHRHIVNYTSGLPGLTGQACAYDAATSSVWFGTSNGVARFANNAFNSFLPGTVVLDLIVNGSDVWVATAAHGVYRLSTATGAQTGNYPVGSGKATSLTVDSTGTLWAGSASGLFRFTGAAFSAEGSLPYVEDIATDGSNNLWIATWDSGVLRRTPAGALQPFAFSSGTVQRVYRIGRDSAGNLLFTHGGAGAALSFLAAAQVNSPAPAFQTFSKSAGFLADEVIAVAAEDAGIWLGSAGQGAWRIGGPSDAPGWPQNLAAFPHYSSPLLVDLDNDRDLEVVVGEESGKVTAFRPDGTILWVFDVRSAFPASQAGDPAIQSSPGAGDVDGDGEIEVVAGVGGFVLGGRGASIGGVLILSRTGQFKRLIRTQDIRGTAAILSDGLSEGVFSTPALANVDADPELEIVFGGLDNLLYAMNGDGTPIYQRDDDGDGRYDEDFLGDSNPYTPFVIADDCPGKCGIDDDGDGRIDEGFAMDDDEDGLVDEDYWEWPRNARDTVIASPLAADLNGDGQKEIIFGHDSTGGSNHEFVPGGVIRVFDWKAQPAFGFPRGNMEQVVWSSPIAIDLDNDGSYEILHGTGNGAEQFGTTPEAQLVGRLVYAWRSNGQPFRSCGAGQPTGCFARTEGRSFASFAAGDLDNDGVPELVIATAPIRDRTGQVVDATGTPTQNSLAIGQQLYAFKLDGSVMPGFPVRPNPIFPNLELQSSPVLVDVDNDGYLDIVLGVRQGLMAFNRLGRVIPGMGVWENLQENVLQTDISTTPAVADIDLDGNLEIIWSAPREDGTKGIVRVVRAGAAYQQLYQRSWPQWRRNMSRNAIFGPVVSITQGWETAGNLVIRAQAFGGHTPIAAVTVNLSAVGGAAAQTMTAGSNAFFEYTTNVAAAAPGRYHLPVTVTDAAGRSDTQVFIFVKRGGTKQLAPSATTLSFGTVRQGETGVAQVMLVNVGTAPVTVTNLVSSNTEFLLAAPAAFPQVVQPGGVLAAMVRFRPGSAAGNRTASLQVQSDDATQPVRTISLTGNTAAGANGCSAELTKLTVYPTAAGGINERGESGWIGLKTGVDGCSWAASSDVPWIQVFPITGFGSTSISYTIFPNTSTRPRSGRVIVNGTVLYITQNHSIATEEQRFVAALYFAAFGRYPSDADINFHVNTMTGDPALKAADFFTSAEFGLLGRFISGIYLGVLGRLPEYGGWLFQRNAVASAGAGAQQALAKNFLQSQEFLISHPSLTNEQFVRFLYQNILGRQPNQAEVNFQLSTLGNGSPEARAQKATEFLNVPEYTSRTGPDLVATLLYFVFLQRNPTPDEFNAMRTRIPVGATRDQLIPIIRELLSTSEYRRVII